MPAPDDPLVLELAIEPRSQRDAELIQGSLQRLAQEAVSFRFSIEGESGQTRLCCKSESDLDFFVASLRQQGLNFAVGAPQVAYRETLGRAAEIEHTHKRIFGPKGDFARVRLTFEPLPLGSGFVFENALVGGSVPEEYIPGVEKGLKSVVNSGPLAGFPVIDFKATLTDGAYHDVDSSPRAFEIAARAAFREAAEKVQMKLLEPIMKVEVVSPEDCVGAVIGDLNARRGLIQGQEMRGNATVINAVAPMALLFGFSERIAILTEERATCRMEFLRYDDVPVHDRDPPPHAGAMAMKA